MSAKPSLGTDNYSRRGAPLGNTNALKHGFYSRRFNRKEKHDLETLTPTDLDSEIHMLRVLVRRTFDACADSEDPVELKSLLHVAAFAAQTITRMARVQSQIKPDDSVNPYEAAFHQAQREMLAEWGYGQPKPEEDLNSLTGGLDPEPIT